MKNIVIYDNFGKITECFIVPSIDIQLMTKGKNWIEGIADPDSDFVENGKITKIPPKPADGYVFNYQQKQWAKSFELFEYDIKKKRNELLNQSDWTQIPNNPLTLAKQEEWAVYRQQLRDITQQSGYPFNVIWPTQPE